MAEQGDGVFVSHTDADDWEHDEETGGLVHLLRADESVEAGLWRAGDVADKSVEVQLGADETVLVLAGSGQIRVDGGPPIELRAGSMISLRKGSKTTWVCDSAFREFWVYS